MSSKIEFKDALDFIGSPQFVVKTPLNGAIISAQGIQADLKVVGSDGVPPLKISLVDTPGGKVLQRLERDGEFTRNQKELIWRFAEARYISEAKGRIDVVVAGPKGFDQAFTTVALPAILGNPEIKNVNGIEASKLRNLYELDQSPRKQISGELTQRVITGEISRIELESPRELLKQGNVNYERMAVQHAIEKNVGEALRAANEKLYLAENRVQASKHAWDTHRAQHAALGRIGNGLILGIPYAIRNVKMWSELRAVNKERDRALYELSRLEKNLRRKSTWEDINRDANQYLNTIGMTNLSLAPLKDRKATVGLEVERTIDATRRSAQEQPSVTVGVNIKPGQGIRQKRGM